jgi:hypothetical protein
MSNIISVLHGYDKDYEPVQDTICRPATIYIKAKKGQMVSRTGLLIEIIETNNKKYLGTVIDETAKYPKKYTGFLAKANQVTYIDEYGTKK